MSESLSLLDPRTLPLPCAICGVSITIGARPCEYCIKLTPIFNRIMGNRSAASHVDANRTDVKGGTNSAGRNCMSKSVTTDANDDVVSVTITPPVATISYGRKVGLPNYSNEEMSIFLQVPLDSVDGNIDFLTIEGQLQPQAAFLKAFVCDQLGVPFETVDGKVVAEVPAAAPKAAGTKRSAGRSTSSPKSNAVSDDERDELFARLAGAEAKGDNWKAPDGETIWDNRTGKKNPKAPDFKFADGGQGLWLDKAPSWFSGPGEGVNL